jgi:hypothetical protein
MVFIIHCSSASWYKRETIERFELVSPDPKSCMIDRYTTGVDNVLVEYTSQTSLQKICSIPFDAEDIKINIRSNESEYIREPVRVASASAPKVHEACEAGRQSSR